MYTEKLIVPMYRSTPHSKIWVTVDGWIISMTISSDNLALVNGMMGPAGGSVIPNQLTKNLWKTTLSWKRSDGLSDPNSDDVQHEELESRRFDPRLPVSRR
ncbi:hypothetical protein PI124_g21083 [Phytophthora idaei]|nr:hypothetical protein PI125_g20056 [Phytophthora idaei]KAG3129556.1 hypothetical protein PI126_g20913 [Phytophthora idaei]KAG3233852.1 hypothetical protein PI124_g21083 [Phytophthora idaei]